MQLKREQVEALIQQGQKRGLKGKDIIDGLVRNGYQPEGVDVEAIKATFSPAPTEAVKPETFGQDLKGDFLGVGKDIISGVKERGANISDIRERVESGETSDIAGIYQTGGELVGSIADTIGSIFKGGVKMVLTPTAEKSVKEGVEKYGTKILENEQVQKGITWFNSLPEETQRNINATGNYVETLLDFAGIGLGARGAKVTKETLETSARSGIDLTKRTVAELGEGAEELVKPAINTITETGKNLGLLPVKEYDEAVKVITKSYKTAFIDDQVAINKRLSLLARQNQKAPDAVIDDLVKAGITPDVEGSLAKFDSVLKEMEDKSKALRTQIKESLKPFDKDPNYLTNIDDFKTQSLNRLKQTADPAEYDKALNQMESVFENYRSKYGDKVTPSQLDEIRVSANDRTKAFDLPVYEDDIYSTIGNVARERFDDIIPEMRPANAEIANLIYLQKATKIFDNQKIKVNQFINQLGSLGGVLAMGGVVGGVVSGSGALVVAGIISKFGADRLASFIRNKKFNKSAIEIIRKSLQENPEALQRLLDTANNQNRKYLEQFLLEAPKEGSPRVQIESGATINQPGRKVIEQGTEIVPRTSQ